MGEPPAILTVDRNTRNLELLEQVLSQAGYVTLKASRLAEVDGFLESPGGISIALVDIAGFDRCIWERCERLRSQQIPFMVLSGKQSVALQEASMLHGARGVLVKPLVIKELLGLVRSLLEA